MMERLEKIEKILEELYPETRKHKNELELLKTFTSDLLLAIMQERKHVEAQRASIDRLERSIDRLEKSIEELRKQSKEDHEGLAHLDEWARKKWGELANRLGTLTEDIFAPGLPHLIKRLGYRIRERMLDVEYGKDGYSRQYDALVIAEDQDGKEALFVAEVKSRARSEDFEQLKTLLEDLLRFKPEYANKKIVPVLAAFKIPEDLISTASSRGVLLVRMGGEYLEPLNPEVVT